MPWSMSSVFTNARTTASSPGASLDCVAIVVTFGSGLRHDPLALYHQKGFTSDA